MNKEIWKDIPGYEGLYQASNLGRIKKIWKTKETIMKPSLQKEGYLRIGLVKNSKRKSYQVHRLIALCFIDNIYNKKYVNHIDGNKQNNNADNLEWVTASENLKHAYDNNLFKTIPGGKNSKPILQYDLNGNFIKKWESQREAGKTLGIQQSNIFKVANEQRNHAGGYVWKYEIKEGKQ